MIVMNVYNYNEKWKTNSMNIYEHPAIYVGDLNSHNTAWGYEKNDENGDLLNDWQTDGTSGKVIRMSMLWN